jgi:chitin synthase
MVGLKVLDYGFNKTRVTNTSNMSESERTFNIFYQLLAGYNEDEKNELDLSDSTNFVYTKGVAPPVRSGTLSRKLTLSRNKSVSKSKPTPESVNQEKEAFENLKSNLKSLGVGRRVQSQIFKVLAAILHLGNLVFYEDENGKCAIKNTETLETCARLLEVSLEQLKNTLLYKSKVVGKDTFSSLLSFLEAPLHRDTLSQCLYSLLFTWLIAHINERLCKPEDDYDCFIAVGDFPFISSNGNESSKIDLFISNYCVEKLYNFNQRVIFEDSIHALKSQGLNINEIQYLDNQYAVDLYDGTARIPGIWKCLQDGLTLEVPPENTFEKTIVVAFDGKLKSSQNYLQSSQCSATETSGNGAVKPLFGVKHYISGPSVEYDIESFYGQDSVVSDFVALFRGVDMSEAFDNNSTFIANLFSSRNGVKVYGGFLKIYCR